MGPGHVPSTPLPGQIGDSEILGRSLTFGAPFGRITHLRSGDVITVTTGEGTFTYRVEDVRYPGDSLPAPLRAGQSRLTLITAGRGGWLDALAPTHAVYVDALLVHGQAQPVPAALPSAGKSSLPMHNQPDALVPLIFWLEALVVVSVGVVWAWMRWGRRQTWIVGAPLVLAVMWGTGDALAQFMPNLI